MFLFCIHMGDTKFDLAGNVLSARASGALWWADAKLLCVSDLHLGKSERIARRGGTLLPPYETRETLRRLGNEIQATDARTVVCLGDSFDDIDAARNLSETDRASICGMMQGRRWIWITGNHDPSLPDIGGTFMAEVARGALTFRHIAQPRSPAGEVSGHYHPKARIMTRAGSVSRACFIEDGSRAILPAFGAYTGGLSTSEHELQSLFTDRAVCILIGSTTTKVPLKPLKTA